MLLFGQSKHCPVIKKRTIMVFWKLKRTFHVVIIWHNDQLVLLVIKRSPHYVQFVFLDCEVTLILSMELTVRLSVLIVKLSF